MAKFEGLEEVISNFNEAVSEIGGDVSEGLEDASLDLLAEAVNRSPIDKGTHRKSGYVSTDKQQIAQGSDTGITSTGSAKGEKLFEIGFGMDYSPELHEDLSLNFQDPNAEHKFLENPLKQNMKKYLNNIRNKAQK